MIIKYNLYLSISPHELKSAKPHGLESTNCENMQFVMNQMNSDEQSYLDCVGAQN
jgi:hypothetical protein